MAISHSIKGPWRWGLAARVLVPIVSLVLFAAAGIGIFEGAATEKQTQTLVSEHANSVLQGIVERVSDRQRPKEIFAQLLADEPNLAQAAEQEDAIGVAQILVPLQAKLGLGYIDAYDIKGRQLLKQSTENDETIFTPLVRDALSGLTASTAIVVDEGLAISAAAPIKGPRGIVGVVEVGTILTGDDLRQVKNQENVELAAFKAGKVTATTVTRSDLMQAMSHFDATPDGLNRLTTALAPFDYYVAAKPLGDSGLLLVLVPTADVTEAAQQRAQIGLSGTLALVLSLIAAGILVRRTINRALNNMIVVTREMIAGNYQLRVAHNSIRELDYLGNTFNHLADQIETQITALRQENAERKHAEQALRESEERYALATRGANDGLWDWDLRANTLYYSSRWKSMLGYADGEISASPDEWLSRIHPDDIDRFRTELANHLNGSSPYLESEYRMRHKSGDYLWAQSRGLAVRNGGGAAYRMAGSLSDITARKRVEEQIIHDAFHDGLTHLPNRALFMDRLGRAVERAKRIKGNVFAVLYLDLDRFKLVNDSLGHSAGDELLIESARRMEVCLRTADTVARFGGDEFVVLLEDIEGIDDAIRVADRIQSELSSTFELSGHHVFNSASIGIVLGGPNYDRSQDVLRDADIAMYRAKMRGRARYEVFDPTMRDRAMARLELETDLRGAVERQEFRVYYQPIMLLESKQITGFEALVRWQHPKRGLVPPMEFIPIAEESGLIIPIGKWVLHEACRQLREWQLRFPAAARLTMSVNLSTRQFAQPDLIDQITETLRATGIQASDLKLEITESLLMDDSVPAAATLEKLRALGVEVQLDDFGTGYSSLSYLQKFPIDTLKIDRSFVSRMGRSAGNGAEIVQTIVTLAQGIGMQVVAEGIETERQLARLKEMGCQFGQGYHISKPLEQSRAEILIAGLQG